MQVEFALFCEAAEISPNGLMYILHGGYDQISSSEFPAVLRRMALVVRLLCEPSECGQQQVFISQIVGPHANAVPPDMTCNFTTSYHPRDRTRRNRMTLLLDYWNLSFPEPADYVFRFIAGGVQIGEAVLELTKIQNES